MNPFEYHDNKLGVQGRFLFDGANADKGSLCLIGERGFRHQLQRKNITRLRAQGPGQPMLVLYSSLPSNWQQLIVKAFGNPPVKAVQSWCEKLWRRDLAALRFYTDFKLGWLTPDKVEEYTVNASVLNLLGELYARRMERRKTIKMTIKGEENIPSLRDSICADINLFRGVVAHTLPNSTKRLFDRYNAYKREGYCSLIHGNEGNSNARVVTVDMERFLNDLFATQTHKPTMAEVHGQYAGFLEGAVEVIDNETGEVYNPAQFHPISEGTVKLYLSKWRNRIATHAIRSGDRQKYMARFKPYHSLEQPKFAGSIISVDDRQPVFWYEKGKRMWFYNGIDLGSEAFTCWVYGTTKEGIILDFYRQMVRNYAEWGFNLPAELEAESALNSSYTNSFLQEGAMFQNVRIEANNARGKRIEQYYRPLRYQYEKDHIGWLARPFALSEANEAGYEKGKEIIVPYNELVTQCLTDIQTWNNAEHSKIKGKSRWQVFCEMQHPNTAPTNYRGIIPYLGYKTETSCRLGIVNLQRREFLLGNGGVISTGENLINLMDRIEGREIDVYWLDGNDGKVLKAYVYTKATATVPSRYICEAIAKPTYQRARIEQTDADLANRELMSKYVASVEGFGNRQRKEINRVTVIDHRTREISNTFVIPGLRNAELRIDELSNEGKLSHSVWKEYAEAEVLDDVEMDLIAVETGYKQDLSMKNNF
ncbi:MAG: hypothetical protein LBU62_09700 [Bacteroidales bacterium]|jgi:hypothetical protein|nr:hypothetical protein [Bacteroidales bacterium]